MQTKVVKPIRGGNTTLAGQSSNPNPQQGTAQLTSLVQGLLQQMQSRFEQMSGNIIHRIEEMSGRIDDLEHSIAELMQQAGVEDGDTATASPVQVLPGKK